MTDRSFEHKRFLVTGASGGIGRAIAHALADLGASLALAGRRADALHTLIAELPSGPHDAIVLDVADDHAWARERVRVAPAGQLHGIVTAAARLAPVGPVGTWTMDEFRKTLETNVVGTLLPIVTLLDPLVQARGAVVTFSGGGATSPFSGYDAYASSKAAVVRLTENLAAELYQSGVRCNSVAPGFVVTTMHRATLAAGPLMAGEDYYERTRVAVESNEGVPAQIAAELTAFLLSDSAQGITGKLISANWDPWRDEGFRRRLVDNDDLATLRRIDDHSFRSVSQ